MDNFNLDDNNKRFIGKNEYEFKTDGSKNFYEILEERRQQKESEGMKKYMPIGSVVMLTNSKKYQMIIGFNMFFDGKIYDYISCEYPYGVDKEHSVIYFDHFQIEKVYNIGYMNDLEQRFKDALNEKSKTI